MHVFEVDFGAAALRQPLFSPLMKTALVSFHRPPDRRRRVRRAAPGVKIRRYESYDRPGGTTPLLPPSLSPAQFPDFADVPEGGFRPRAIFAGPTTPRPATDGPVVSAIPQDALREKSPARNKRIREDFGVAIYAGALSNNRGLSIV